MPEAVTPPNPDQTDAGRFGNPPQTVPDPTLMTIDALRREIAMLEALFDSKLQATESLIQERIRRIDALAERAEEMRQEQKADTKAAVQQALDAQKEATAKMESSTAAQIDSLRNNFDTAIRGVHSNIADLKERMTVAESVKVGTVQAKDESRAVSGTLIAAIGVGIALLLAVLTIISFMATGA